MVGQLKVLIENISFEISSFYTFYRRHSNRSLFHAFDSIGNYFVDFYIENNHIGLIVDDSVCLIQTNCLVAANCSTDITNAIQWEIKVRKERWFRKVTRNKQDCCIFFLSQQVLREFIQMKNNTIHIQVFITMSWPSMYKHRLGLPMHCSVKPHNVQIKKCLAALSLIERNCFNAIARLICMQTILLDFLFRQTVAGRKMCEQTQLEHNQLNYIMRLNTALNKRYWKTRPNATYQMYVRHAK